MAQGQQSMAHDSEILNANNAFVLFGLPKLLNGNFPKEECKTKIFR